MICRNILEGYFSHLYYFFLLILAICDANERFAELRKIMKLMPPHNYAVFKKLMFHLNKYVPFLPSKFQSH